MTYPFLPFEVVPSPAYPFDHIYRPVVPILIGAEGGRRSPFYGLLDTGADDSKISLSQAERLGVVLDRGRPIPYRGVGGLTFGYFGEVTMELRQSPKSYVWNATVAFIPDPGEDESDRARVSLGHTGFFRYFLAKFDFMRRQVDLTPNKLFVGLPR